MAEFQNVLKRWVLVSATCRVSKDVLADYCRRALQLWRILSALISSEYITDEPDLQAADVKLPDALDTHICLFCVCRSREKNLWWKLISVKSKSKNSREI